MWISKLLGAVFIIGATSMYGYSLTKELQCRIDTLKQLKRTFLLLKSEIRYSASTLPEAFMRVGEKCGTKEALVRDFFWGVGKGMRREDPPEFQALWEQEGLALAKEAHLDGRDVDKLSAAAQGLGYLDEIQQLGNIDLYVETLEEDIKELSEKYKAASRMYTGLGIMSGLFLTIILL